ncbi:MAG: isoprenylcysteine carboxylmethyltransferase family protein [Chthoniobacterales bacterium]|nr:isoprenylcysteine carboxylmethyltransferase family protein [Chthoniobacterales bacterium]
MNLPGPQYLGFAYLASELLLGATRRSRGTGIPQDRSTLRMLWLVILLSVAAGLYVASQWRFAALPETFSWRIPGLLLFVVGLAVRWWAIITLGRFFTVDVQISKDHHVVERGPFRVVRHPSYTGVLLAFLGFAVSLGNWAAMLVMLVPIFVAFLRRMNVEEQALSDALGEEYVSYMRRTKRLVPFIY